MNIEELQKQMINSPMNTREFIALSLLQGLTNKSETITSDDIEYAFDSADKFIEYAAHLRLEEGTQQSDKPCNCDEK